MVKSDRINDEHAGVLARKEKKKYIRTKIEITIKWLETCFSNYRSVNEKLRWKRQRHQHNRNSFAGVRRAVRMPGAKEEKRSVVSHEGFAPVSVQTPTAAER